MPVRTADIITNNLGVNRGLDSPMKAWQSLGRLECQKTLRCRETRTQDPPEQNRAFLPENGRDCDHRLENASRQIIKQIAVLPPNSSIPGRIVQRDRIFVSHKEWLIASRGSGFETWPSRVD